MSLSSRRHAASRALLLLGITAGVTGCLLPPAQESQSSKVDPNAWQMGGSPEGQVLYGRDGSPVSTGAPAPGSTLPQPTAETSEGPLNHGPAGDEPKGSRPVILELYQQAVNDRERLSEELSYAEKDNVEAYDKIEKLEAELAAVRLDLETERANRAAVEARQFELAERLATAQLRRYEAERLLLQKTLEAQTSQ